MGEMKNAYKILVGKPERQTPLWKQRHMWENNIELHYKVVGCECVNMLMNL
jgi:hypothetical protein